MNLISCGAVWKHLSQFCFQAGGEIKSLCSSPSAWNPVWIVSPARSKAFSSALMLYIDIRRRQRRQFVSHPRHQLLLHSAVSLSPELKEATHLDGRSQEKNMDFTVFERTLPPPAPPTTLMLHAIPAVSGVTSHVSSYSCRAPSACLAIFLLFLI